MSFAACPWQLKYFADLLCLISDLSYLKKIVVDEHAVPGSGGIDDDRRDLAIPIKYRK